MNEQSLSNKNPAVNYGAKNDFIFPNIPNLEMINRIRDMYDPLAKLVAPHITVVFPFEPEMGDAELGAFLERKLEHVRSFTISVEMIGDQEESVILFEKKLLGGRLAKANP